MNLTEFGSAVRKARIDARVTLQKMAEELGVTPAFLSGLEVGRKRIPEEWVKKIEEFFRKRKVDVPNLPSLADVANKSVSLEGLAPQHQLLVAGFARSRLTREQLERFTSLLAESKKEK